MAVPRIFISSTCYDLAEIRDSLVSFFQSFGFESALSDRGDVFYHPDLHTHEACVGEVSNCHMLVLVIGGRFGGQYVADKTRSITNAEYTAAKLQNIPVFAFIKQDVLNDHNVWQRNKGKPFADQIVYPSIEKQEHAVDIFSFIDVVRHAEVNNGFFGFRVARDLEELLRKQIAGMFFDFLTRRNVSKQIQSTSDTVNSLTVVANTIEDLVKSLYLQINSKSAAEAIQTADAAAQAEAFFVEVARLVEDKNFIMKSKIEEALKNNAENWRQGLLDTGFFQYGMDPLKPQKKGLFVASEIAPNSENVLSFLGMTALTDNEGNLLDKDADTESRLDRSWQIFRNLPIETRRKIYARYSHEPKHGLRVG